MRARYYDPDIARFITEDSERGKDNDPLSLNLYTYCQEDPINNIDPSGHYALPYSPDKTNKDTHILQTTNCYAYSMNLKSYTDGTSFSSSKYLFGIAIGGWYGYRIENGGINPGDIADQQAQSRLRGFLDSTKNRKGPLTSEQKNELNQLIKDSMSVPEFNTKDFSNIIECIRADAAAMDLKFQVMGKDEKCPDDMYKICVGWTAGKDYHFLRQNADGSWSSKPGAAPVKWDGYNPEKATNKENYAYFAIGNPSAYENKRPYQLQ